MSEDEYEIPLDYEATPTPTVEDGELEPNGRATNDAEEESKTQLPPQALKSPYSYEIVNKSPGDDENERERQVDTAMREYAMANARPSSGSLSDVICGPQRGIPQPARWYGSGSTEYARRARPVAPRAVKVSIRPEWAVNSNTRIAPDPTRRGSHRLLNYEVWDLEAYAEQRVAVLNGLVESSSSGKAIPMPMVYDEDLIDYRSLLEAWVVGCGGMEYHSQAVSEQRSIAFKYANCRALGAMEGGLTEREAYNAIKLDQLAKAAREPDPATRRMLMSEFKDAQSAYMTQRVRERRALAALAAPMNHGSGNIPSSAPTTLVQSGAACGGPQTCPPHSGAAQQQVTVKVGSGQTTKSSHVRHDASLVVEAKPPVASCACASSELLEQVEELKQMVADQKAKLRKALLKYNNVATTADRAWDKARGAELRLDAFLLGQQSARSHRDRTSSKRPRPESDGSCDDVESQASEGSSAPSDVESVASQPSAQSAGEESDGDVEMESETQSKSAAVEQPKKDVAEQQASAPLRSHHRVKSVARKTLKGVTRGPSKA